MLRESTDLISRRQKLIKFADRSEAGWAVVDEYVDDDLADDSEDEKRMEWAERMARDLHILGRSGASLKDQTLFNQCRLDCIQELSIPIVTSTENPITDILRFFYGDGLAQQLTCTRRREVQ